jgi:hypothetical protein
MTWPSGSDQSNKNEGAPDSLESLGRPVEQPSPEVCSQLPYDSTRFVGMAPMGYCEKVDRQKERSPPGNGDLILWQTTRALCESFFGHACAPKLLSPGASRPASSSRSDASLP